MRVLVAGVGNLLRGDDGFGVVVARRLLERGTPEGVHVIDVGIGGIHLVQELLDPVDMLVVVDTIDLDRPPGTVLVTRPDVRDVTALSPTEQRDELADMHYTKPERAFMLARGLGVLPPSTWVIGCQPVDAERLGEGLSPPVAQAVDTTIAEVLRVITDLRAHPA